MRADRYPCVHSRYHSTCDAVSLSFPFGCHVLEMLHQVTCDDDCSSTPCHLALDLLTYPAAHVGRRMKVRT